MLICLGGILGNGRKILAQKIARSHNLYLYDTDSKKIHFHVREKDGSVREVTRRPRTTELRSFLYKRILEGLPRLAKMYPDMLIDDSFHMKEPREHFLTEARKCFDDVTFVWVDSDPSHVEQRLEKLEKMGLIKNVEKVKERRLHAMRMFEPLPSDVPVFMCESADDVEAEALWALIESKREV
jgi:hypothetical protein